jgi:predicted nucleotidyltransferase
MMSIVSKDKGMLCRFPGEWGDYDVYIVVLPTKGVSRNTRWARQDELVKLVEKHGGKVYPLWPYIVDEDDECLPKAVLSRIEKKIEKARGIRDDAVWKEEMTKVIFWSGYIEALLDLKAEIMKAGGGE